VNRLGIWESRDNHKQMDQKWCDESLNHGNERLISRGMQAEIKRKAVGRRPSHSSRVISCVVCLLRSLAKLKAPTLLELKKTPGATAIDCRQQRKVN
jgi:hypothetical protein